MHRDVQTTCLVELETPWKRKLRFHFRTKSLRYPQLSIRGKQYAFFSLSESENKFSLALTPGVSHSLSLTLALTCRSNMEQCLTVSKSSPLDAQIRNGDHVLHHVELTDFTSRISIDRTVPLYKTKRTSPTR